MINQRKMTRSEREAFLAMSHVGVISIASDSTRPPLAVPIWYAYEPGGNLTVNTGTTSQKARLIEETGRLSLTAQCDDVPYKYVTVEGTVIQTDRPPSADQLFAILRRYLPEEQARGMVGSALDQTTDERVLFTIRPDRWLSADFSAEG